MNRRQFLSTLAAVPLAGLVKDVPIPGTWGAVVRSEVPFFVPHPAQVAFFEQSEEIVAYMRSSFNLHVNNPRQCMHITGIGE